MGRLCEKLGVFFLPRPVVFHDPKKGGGAIGIPIREDAPPSDRPIRTPPLPFRIPLPPFNASITDHWNTNTG